VSPGHVLLVDDEDDIRRLARMSLERVGGWTVTDAGSAGEALAAAREQRFDAVLLDVMMPDVDGPGTLALLRPVIGPDVPVVFLTAKVQPADVARLRELGAAGVLAKPFDPMGLPGELERLLGAS
jgi:two-component system, OmpR family, response regulator